MSATERMKVEKRGNELTITHILPVSRPIAFSLWTDPRHLANWWGPKGFTNPVCEVDPTPGGAILIHMRAPDGTVHPMRGEFLEIVEPEKLVFVSSAMDKEGNPLFEVLNTVTFSVVGASTKIVMHAVVSKIRLEGMPNIAGMEEGWKQSIVRLDEYAAKQK